MISELCKERHRLQIQSDIKKSVNLHCALYSKVEWSSEKISVHISGHSLLYLLRHWLFCPLKEITLTMDVGSIIKEGGTSFERPPNKFS